MSSVLSGALTLAVFDVTTLSNSPTNSGEMAPAVVEPGVSLSSGRSKEEHSHEKVMDRHG